MLKVAIRFGIMTPILYIACQLAAKYYWQQTAYYDGLLKIMGGN